MCRVTRWHHQQFHLKLSDLEKRLNVLPLPCYLARRRLRWAGQVARMEFDHRIPRKLLSSWIPKKRPVGRPQAAYGHSLIYDLKNAGVPCSSWHYLAADEVTWEDILRRDDIHIRPPNPLYEPLVSQVDSAPPTLAVSKSNVKSYKDVLVSGPSSTTAASSLILLLQDTPKPPSSPSDDSCIAVTTISNPTVLSPPPSIQVSNPLTEQEEPQQLTPSSSFTSHHENSPTRCVNVEPRRSARIAARIKACGGRRCYSNKPQIVE